MATPINVSIETVEEIAPTATAATPAINSPSLVAVSIKLPPFWPIDPTVWFLQVKAQFNTRGITSLKTKFDYVIASLSPEIAFEVRDLFIRPPPDTPYDTLKAELIKQTAASEQRKLQQLISGEELGDCKPTQLLRSMQQLLSDHLSTTPENNTFLKELFLQRLPANVRIVFTSADTATDLSNLAEKIVEVAIATVSESSAESNNSRQKCRTSPTS